MRKIFFILLLAGGGYLLYRHFFIEKNFEIRDNIVVSKASDLNPDAPSISGSPKYAFIEGEIKNICSRQLDNIEITYTVGYDTLKALAGSLLPMQSVNFKTNSCIVRSNTPAYELEVVLYDEEN